MAQLASSSSTSISRYTYDAFLSFRGEDTRLGFTGHLYSALSRRGIYTFIDDAALRRGEEITPSLCKAIQESRIAIIIFSKDYASSTFCLDELVHILECCTKQNREIWPVFYDIDPSHVRNQTESYQKAFAKHQSGRFKDNVEKVQKWRSALSQAADLAGWHFKIGEESESKFIEKITEDVSNKLNRCPLHIADYPVGLQARIQQIQWLMGAEFDNKVTMLGIHGMGGIGKSTLARAIYNLKAHQFEASCFVANVREKSSTKQGLVQIQETMLSELVGGRDVKLGDVNQGIPLLQHRLGRKKVLLVLDDIDKKQQLKATAGGLDWFGPGSIIIITTRDKHLLDIHGVEIEKQYKVDEFNDGEALDLLRWNAFKNKEVGPGYEEIMKRAIYCASRLPLALEIIGSDLFGKTLDECDSALKAYESIPNSDVLDILRVSYDSLQHNEQEIFSDIACFFRGCPLGDVANILEARGFHPKFGIGVLEKKSLIKIDRDNGETVMMHDLIQSMGREIVRKRSTRPHNRNRLYIYEDIACVLEKNEDNDNIEALMLDLPEDQEVQWNPEVFGKMKNLQMLLIKKNVGFQRGSIDLPNSLRVLEWRGYPETSLPSTFRPKNLSILNLSCGDFKWDKDKPLQNSNVLRHLILRGCKNIRRIPNTSSLSNLTELCVCECTNLIEIDESVGYLKNLQRFCAEGCRKLKIGLRGISLKSLEYLSLRDCSILTMFPEILAPMPKLKFVDLGGTAIENLPLSMQNLEGLQTLFMERCKMLQRSAPSNFFQKLAELFPNLTKLNIQGSNLRILPECIEEFCSLRSINVSNCKKLQEIKALPPNIIEFSAHNTAVGADSTLNMLLKQAIGSTAISYYGLPGQRIPEWFDHSTNENTLFFWFRNKLPHFTVCAHIGVGHKIKRPCRMKFHFIARINNIDMCVSCSIGSGVICISDYDHLYMFNIQNDFHKQKDSEIERTLKTNEWIHGNVSFVMASEDDSGSLGIIKGIGVLLNEESTRMKNVRFTDPNAPKLEQKQSLTLFNPGNREKILHEPAERVKRREPYTIPSGSKTVKQHLGNVSASRSGGLDYECKSSRITRRPQMSCSKQLPQPHAERGKGRLGMLPPKRKPGEDRWERMNLSSSKRSQKMFP